MAIDHGAVGIVTGRTAVNGLFLPADLVGALAAEWVERVDKAAAGRRLNADLRGLRFFELDFVLGPLAAQWLELPSEFRGSADPDDPPGDIDPSTSVVFGEGVADQPIALDYRTARPSVVTLNSRGHWQMLAESADVFLDHLDPEGELRGLNSA